MASEPTAADEQDARSSEPSGQSVPKPEQSSFTALNEEEVRARIRKTNLENQALERGLLKRNWIIE
jgi:hypothetical protein